MKTIIKVPLMLLTAIFVVILCFVLSVAGINVYIMVSADIVTELDSETAAVSEEERAKYEELAPQCAIVLGAGITDAETPSPMLKDRLDAGVLLYKSGIVNKLLLSGDNGSDHHDEIHVMLKYCKNAGVPGKDIFCDHAGFSTYDTMYRAVSIYEVERAVVVTQRYHLYRALYLARSLGIDAVGTASDQRPHQGQDARDTREFLARVKDFFQGIQKPPAKYGGPKTPITMDSGASTHGE